MQYKTRDRIVGFNGLLASSKTEEAFLSENTHLGLTEEELKEAYQLIMEKYGDNTGIQKENPKTKTKSPGGSKGGNRGNGGSSAVSQPGADDGGKA